jgi:hypothetical protein
MPPCPQQISAYRLINGLNERWRLDQVQLEIWSFL